MTMEIKNGVIIFLDALGVSHYNYAAEYVDFVCEVKKLKIRTNYVWKKWQKEFEKAGVILPEPEIVTFQDTIIVSFPEPEGNYDSKTLHYFFAAGQWLMQVIGLAIEKKIFFRGAISVGEYIFNDSTGNVSVMGKPISDAYEFEKEANWIGVIQTPTFQDQYMKAIEIFAEQEKVSKEEIIGRYRFMFLPYRVPLSKGGTKEYFVTSWPTPLQKTGYDEIEKILLETSQSVDTKYKPKYENTLTFLRSFVRRT
jgi:hypothetical protein